MTVPDVTTTTVTQATSALKAKGFTVTVTPVKNSKPNGTVFKQTPVGGTKAKSGSTVKLSVSEQSSVKVPNVVGHNQATAGARLGHRANVGTTNAACSSSYCERSGVGPEPGRWRGRGARGRP